MDEITELLTRCSELKREIDSLSNQHQAVRDQIYNYLVNNNLDNYSNDQFNVFKTEDTEYLKVSKSSLLNALSQVNLTLEQRTSILRFAFQSVTKSGGIQIRNK